MLQLARKPAPWLWMILVAATLSGCGPKPKPTGKLQGKVTYEGKAVDQAKIQIQMPSTGEAFAAKTGQDGSYQFDTPVTAGEYVATIVPDYEAPPAGNEPVPSKPPERNDIPEKYRTPTSGLKFEVKTGDNTYDVDMKK